VVGRLLVTTGVIACLALSACGGSGDTSSTTPPPPPDQTSVHWSRCAGGAFQISTSGMSCVAARQFASIEAFGKATTGGTDAEIAKSDPRTFTSGAFHCTAFPEGVNAAWHVLCAYRDKHVSFFIAP
jgi:hypothetical protein